MKRRDFLKVSAAAAATLTGCSKRELLEETVPEVSASQAARKYQGRSKVALIRCQSYEDEMVSLLASYSARLSLPSLKGKRVVLKPNMVEYQPDRPITTNPALLSSAIKFARNAGAREIIVAEGPGHMRDSEYLLKMTGIGQACRENDVPFIDLNLDDIEAVDNEDGFTGIKKFYLPRTILEADVVISVPKLKTHHWVGVTCSMKNFFGAVPGRKYGWPKNLLHIKGIPRSIIDLVHLVKPAFAIVDGIVCMEGDGPIMGTPLHVGFIGMGADLAALDATCIRITSIDPEKLSYMVLAGKTVGNIDESKIDVIGASVKDLRKEFEQPATLKDKSLLARAAEEGS